MKDKGKVTIIAEAGVNHNGQLDLAKKLIEKAALAGADYVKFQTFKANRLVNENAEKADYQKVNTGKKNESQFDMLRKLEIPDTWYSELIDCAKANNIKFLSSPFDTEDIDFLDNLGLDLFKVPSGEITNLPYLQRIAQKGKPVVLSTGMATIDEIKDALDIFISGGIPRKNITVLHCTTSYPTPMSEVNLKAMLDIEKQCAVSIGYSDHTLGIEVPVAAVALGATVIEKHFTLDKNMKGPDHRASLSPEELSLMVSSIRNVEKALSGSGKKTPTETELKNKSVVRKSIHLKRDLNEGHRLTDDDLVALRPGNGISPMKWYEVIGKRLIKNLKANTLLKWEDIR